MLTLRDCIDYVELTEDEIDAIAEHEHLPTMIATELANYLVETDEGVLLIRRCIIDDIAHAHETGNRERLLVLKGVLRHFVNAHPVHGPGQKGQSAH